MLLVKIVNRLNSCKHVVVVVLLPPESCFVVLENDKGLVLFRVLRKLSHDLLGLIPGSVYRHHRVDFAYLLFCEV